MHVTNIPIRVTLGSNAELYFTVVNNDGSVRNLVENADTIRFIVTNNRGLQMISLQTDSGIIQEPNGNVRVSMTPVDLSPTSFDPDNDTYSYLIEITDGTNGKEWPLASGQFIPEK